MHISSRGVFGLRSAALSDVLKELRHYSSASFAVPTRNGHAGVATPACRTENCVAGIGTTECGRRRPHQA